MIVEVDWAGPAIDNDVDMTMSVQGIPGYGFNYTKVGYCGSTQIDSLSYAGDSKGLITYEYFGIDLVSLSSTAIGLGSSTATLGISGYWFEWTSPAPQTVTITYKTYTTGDIVKVGNTYVSTATPANVYTRTYSLPVVSPQDCTNLQTVTNIIYQIANDRIYIP